MQFSAVQSSPGQSREVQNILGKPYRLLQFWETPNILVFIVHSYLLYTVHCAHSGVHAVAARSDKVQSVSHIQQMFLRSFFYRVSLHYITVLYLKSTVNSIICAV